MNQKHHNIKGIKATKGVFGSKNEIYILIFVGRESHSLAISRASYNGVHCDRSLLANLHHLAGQESGDQNESSSGPDSGPDLKKAIIVHKHISLQKRRKSERTQDRRTRSDALLKNPDRRRPASLDLNNVSGLSPRWGAVNKNSVVTRKLGAFPSPGTPNYHHHSSFGMQKGWSSERVPLHNNGGSRQGNTAGLLAFNNGRTLPSKWEDAERWICSPISVETGARQSIVAPQRRPKSKSVPLGPPGIAHYSLYSPGNFMVGSPFSAGAIAVDGLTTHSHYHGGEYAVRTEPCMARYLFEVNAHLYLAKFLDAEENLDVKDATTDISRTVSRRDMATQMRPQSSTHSSPKEMPSLSPSSSSALPIMELSNIHSSKSELRDVPVDERVTMTRWSKKHSSQNTGKSTEIVDDWRTKAVDTWTTTRDVTETGKSISKIKREAKITAWENLQKAQAEAAIRKLDMKLEKKRSSSMDKIMNKLRSAPKRAHEMRSSMLANQAHQAKTSHMAISFRRTRQMGSLSGCFNCHAI
ncbi:uncharacterized protein LOC120198849 [Hibiscus syriacus]|uniref:uncharacterized protein LOC120198849 n=1 Tax=Hibiscus syriacus TaxID=106335 RepID=UPI0019246F53|nr:uncharacterized protein LOC120198849 [Hibiscus syriacus]